MSTSVRHFLKRVAEDDNERISEAWEQLSEAERHEAEQLAEAEPLLEMPVSMMFQTINF